MDTGVEENRIDQTHRKRWNFDQYLSSTLLCNFFHVQSFRCPDLSFRCGLGLFQEIMFSRGTWQQRDVVARLGTAGHGDGRNQFMPR